MRNIFCFITLCFLLFQSCSSTIKTINVDIRENKLFVQNKEITVYEFEKELNELTKGLSEQKLKKVNFSVKMDGKSNLGIISDLKIKIENWKESKSN